MSEGIHGEANEYDAGLSFDYSVWSANSSIQLCSVPWDANYEDVVSFGTAAQRDAYFAGLPSARTTLYKNATRVRTDQPIRIDMPQNKALQYNYVKVVNPAAPVSVGGPDVARTFYYFIVDVIFVNPNCTALIVQLDAWTTYMLNVAVQNCYVERGHIGIANENQMRNYGRDFLTVPEGLDLGTDYVVNNVFEEQVMEIPNDYHILALSVNELEADPGNKDDPNRVTASGGKVGGVITGANVYWWDTQTEFRQFLSDYKRFPWVTAGIISITMIPKFNRYFPENYRMGTFIDTIHGYRVTSADGDSANATRPHVFKSNWRSDPKILSFLGDRYKHLKKFLTSPYMILELTTMTGTPLALKPEVWSNNDLIVTEAMGYAPPAQRVVIYPRNYGANMPTLNANDDFGIARNGEWYDIATMITNFPTVAVVNDQALLAYASQAHGLAYSHESAQWSQSRALRGNDVSYGQAQRGIGATQDQAALSRRTDQLQTQLGNRTQASQALWGGLTGTAAGIAGGPISAGMAAAQAAAGSVSTGISIGANDEAYGIRAAASRAGTDIATGQASYVADTNKALADWATRGEYANTIAGINAKVQDLRMTQPTTIGQTGGETFNLSQHAFGYYLKIKTIDPAILRQVGDYWLRFGYSVQRFVTSIPRDLHCMTRFTYWKLQQTYITGDIPETYKNTIRGILEKGVTVWKRPEDIGRIDIADNAPLGGIRLD